LFVVAQVENVDDDAMVIVNVEDLMNWGCNQV